MPTENGLGVQDVLRFGVSGSYPMSFAETPGGLLLLANGIDPMLIWDGLAGSADTAGVAAPSAAMELGGVGLGTITGSVVAFQRFLDASGNTSDLSPVSNVMEAGTDGLIQDINFNPTSGAVTITSADHGLASGASLIISGVEGSAQVNGSWVVTVTDSDHLVIRGLSVTSGFYTQGGTWTSGVLTVVYGAVPLPAEPKVVRRQILRNLQGNAETLYVDIDTADLASTTFMSQATDEQLAASEAVPLTYGDEEIPFASRHGLPPSHKAVVVAHKGRMFATADAPYSDGHVRPVFNSTIMQGVGTAWTASMAGRVIYVDGASKPYSIAAVDAVNQRLTLAAKYLEPPTAYALYSILPEAGERRLVYFSEPGLPESWPAWNAIAVPECNDYLVGLVTLGQYLYLVERRHLHRLTYQDSPGQDGWIFLVANRGALSNRTIAVTDAGIFMMDEIGVHKFDGNEATPISAPIQNLFRQDGTTDLQLDWSADQRLWHAAHDPARDTVRWFVTMVGQPPLVHAVCYNYRSERWWVERYPTPMTSSTNATIGYRRSLAGTEFRRVVCLSEGTYDGVSAGAGTLRGTVTSADATSLTDSSATFPALEGTPVAIVAGTGRGQVRIILPNTATNLPIDQPWDAGKTPDASSVYQVGGILWEWRSGWFRFHEDESENPRDVEVVFRPTPNPALLDIELFLDHSTSPVTWSRQIAQDGVRTTKGRPQITVDLSVARGFARQRLSGHADPNAYADRFVSVQLSGVQAADAVTVSQVIIKGVEEA